MTQPDQQFRIVMRGYDPADVDRVVTGLRQRAEEAESSATEYEERWKQSTLSASEVETPEPSFERLGDRVGQILSLAEEESREMRERTQAEAEETRKLADQAAVSTRDEADQYADQRRRDADTEVAQILADARRSADEERDAAERDAAAMRQEGEAVFEQQRANAAKAAADFETTLAERRDRTTAEFREQQANTQMQLDAMMQRVEETREAAQREQEAAEAEARRIVVEAEARSETLVREARAAADRVRTESDRELAAATQRRDSINAQLTNVRQMLATLTGSAAGFAVDPLPGGEDVTPGPEQVELLADPGIDADPEADIEAEGDIDAEVALEDGLEDEVEADDEAESEVIEDEGAVPEAAEQTDGEDQEHQG
jgi:hypothetical protein